MKIYWKLSFIFLFKYSLYSQEETLKNRLCPDTSGDSSPQYIVEKITNNLNNDSLKVKAIYEWVTQNIAYDHRFRRRLEGDTILYQEPNIVVERKKAVCIGYSKLIKEMCRLVNIKAVVVTGYAKNNNRLESDEHAWNAVKIHDNWYLLDATWGAGDAFIAKTYFLTDPSAFVKNHLPHDPMWQLLQKPIRWECYTEGDNCHLKFNPDFNFKDTISNWLQLDTLNQKLNESLRILAFNPKDLDAIRGLAEYFSIKAYHYFLEYTTIKQAVKDKKRPANQQTEILTLINNAAENLKLAISQQERIIPFAKPNRYTDAHMNIDILKENLSNLELEKAFVLKYFKN